MHQSVNSYLAMTLVASVAIGASYLMIKFSELESFAGIPVAIAVEQTY